MNTVNTEIAIQLKMIREKIYQGYPLENGCKSPSLENNQNNKNTKQFSDPQARKENINEAAETNNKFHWP